MAGYAIQARVDGVRPRLTALAGTGPDGDATRTWPAFLADHGFEEPFADLTDVPQPSLAEHWERGREVWAQTTFFLFDPNSWR